MYKCTIMGGNGGSTVFRGLPTSSLFVDCTGNQGRIVLPHSLFSLPQGIKKSCNNGAIIARSLKGGNGIYTSQLSVTVTSELIGDAIECAHDNGTDIIDVVRIIISDTGVNLFVLNHTISVYIMSVNFLMQDVFPLHLLKFILARLVSTQTSSHFSGTQLPLIVLLSTTTS